MHPSAGAVVAMWLVPACLHSGPSSILAVVGIFFTSHRLLVLGKPHEIGLFTIFMFSGLGMGQAP